MKLLQKIIPILVLLAAIFVSGIFSSEWPLAQGQTRAKFLEDKGTFSEKGKWTGRPERNPFFFPPGVRLLPQGASASAPREKAPQPKTQHLEVSALPVDAPPIPLKLKAILISDSVSLAAVDQYIVTVGDFIKDEKVLEIKTDRVILGRGDKKRTLPLWQSPIPLTVEEK